VSPSAIVHRTTIVCQSLPPNYWNSGWFFCYPGRLLSFWRFSLRGCTEDGPFFPLLGSGGFLVQLADEAVCDRSALCVLLFFAEFPPLFFPSQRFVVLICDCFSMLRDLYVEFFFLREEFFFLSSGHCFPPPINPLSPPSPPFPPVLPPRKRHSTFRYVPLLPEQILLTSYIKARESSTRSGKPFFVFSNHLISSLRRCFTSVIRTRAFMLPSSPG